MKIFIVFEESYEGGYFNGAYSTKEKALEACDWNDWNITDIQELDLDPPNLGERHEVFFFCRIEGDEIEISSYKHEPRDMEDHNPYILGQLNAVVGAGRTEQEARQQAEKARKELSPVWQISDNYEIHHSHPSLIHKWEDLDNPQPYAVHADRNVAIIALQEYKANGKISPFLVFGKT